MAVLENEIWINEVRSKGLLHFKLLNDELLSVLITMPNIFISKETEKWRAKAGNEPINL